MSQQEKSVESLLGTPDAGWFLTLYPDAGEAGGAFVSSVRAPRSWVPAGHGEDPGRARSEAGRRARSKVRRYCAANGLNRLGTLTYRGSGCHDQMQLRADVAAFFLALRCLMGGRGFPYVWVPEWHKTDHGLHVHFAVGQFIPRGLIEQAWGHGFVHIKSLSDMPVGSSRVSEARRAAGYLSKYVSKSFAPDCERRLAGLHRYEVGQGFQPQTIRLAGRSVDEVLDAAVEKMGGELPSREWFSEEAEVWFGPPAVSFTWG